MKHIQTFEKYQPVNELTGALVDRAKKVAQEREKDLNTDVITSNLKKRQAISFKYYINPNIKDLANKLGFKVFKDGEWFKITIGENYFWISEEGNYEGFDPENFDSTTLRKIQRFTNAVKADYNVI